MTRALVGSTREGAAAKLAALAAAGEIDPDPAQAKVVAKLDALAARVALSPSRFAARFRETMGESVMAYVGRWRLNVACRLLRETESPLDRIAERVAGVETRAADVVGDVGDEGLAHDVVVRARDLDRRDRVRRP